MSATSGISVSPTLSAKFSEAVEIKSTRFVKVSIQNESLIHDLSIPAGGSLDEDLAELQSNDVLQDDTPAYVLAKLDDPPTEWLVIYYVPDSAKVRDKMLYAASRNSLLRSLGSTAFTDSIFATSKADFTSEAYAAHRRSIAAPQPMSTQEKEMAIVRAAERQAGGVTYEASHVRSSPLGWKLSDGVEEALKNLDDGKGSGLVVLSVDTKGESLLLKSASDTDIAGLPAALPQDEPCYAFFAWSHNFSSQPRRDIIFIYCCPPHSPVKYRMMYSSGCLTTPLVVKPLFTKCTIAARKVETSDPKELTELHLREETGLNDQPTISRLDNGVKKPFAKPRGPARRS